jgi:methylmalonyl-CoA mutase
MTPADDDLLLAAEFPAATYEQWRKLVDGVLKGAPFDKLPSRSADGLTIEPLYPRAAGAAPIAGRAGGTRWRVMQRIDHPDPDASNTESLHELDNGADGLVLIPAGAIARIQPLRARAGSDVGHPSRAARADAAHGRYPLRT